VVVPWLQTIAGTTGRGIGVRRARIVAEPISEYIRFEYDITFTNAAAGELVRWLPRSQAADGGTGRDLRLSVGTD
jgi:hypothetical protein